MKTLFCALALLLCSCGGDTSVDVSNEQSQNQGTADGEDVNTSGICAQCIGNSEDGLTDEECLAAFGVDASDC